MNDAAPAEIVSVDRWRNRRAMAWLSLLASLLFPLLALTAGSDALTALAGPFYVFTGAVVSAYIGFATMDDKWQAPPKAISQPVNTGDGDA